MPRETLSLGDRRDALARLASVLRGLEIRGPEVSPEAPPVGADPGVVRTGWPGIDALGGLSRGLLHEWFGVAESTADESATGPSSDDRRPRRVPWTPPLRILATLAERARGGIPSAGGWVCWIGSKVWPYPRALIPRERLSVWGEPGRTPDESAGVSGSTDLLASSLFVDPPDDAVRLWAIDLALRCKALAAVVADARGLTMAASRRLQLAAEKTSKNGGPLVLLARPPADRATPSVAGTRWLVNNVHHERSSSMNPRWSIEVLRWKGRGRASPPGLSLAASSEAGRRWTLEWRHAESDVVESPVVVDGSSDPGRSQGRSSGSPPPSGVLSGSGPPEFVETFPPRGVSASAL